jgi:hypothetical protein
VEAGPQKELLEVTLSPDGYSRARQLLVRTEAPWALGVLERRLVGVVELARRLNAADGEIRRFAELRLETLRKLGRALSATGLRGGVGGSRRLPDGISRRVSSQAQQLARMPEEEFWGRMEKSRVRRALPSLRWMLNPRSQSEERESTAMTRSEIAKPNPAAEPLPLSDLWSWVASYMQPDARLGDFPDPLSQVPVVRSVAAEKLTARSLVATTHPELAGLLERLGRGEHPDLEMLVVLAPGAIARWLGRELPRRWVLLLIPGCDAYTVVYWGPRWHGFAVGARRFGMAAVSAGA